MASSPENLIPALPESAIATIEGARRLRSTRRQGTERLFEFLRSRSEGPVYASLDDKVAAVIVILWAFDADPARVRRLTGWAWIHGKG